MSISTDVSIDFVFENDDLSLKQKQIIEIENIIKANLIKITPLIAGTSLRDNQQPSCVHTRKVQRLVRRVKKRLKRTYTQASGNGEHLNVKT